MIIDDRSFEGEYTYCTNTNCTGYGERVECHPGIQKCVCKYCVTHYDSPQAKRRIAKQYRQEAELLESEASVEMRIRRGGGKKTSKPTGEQT